MDQTVVPLIFLAGAATGFVIAKLLQKKDDGAGKTEDERKKREVKRKEKKSDEEDDGEDGGEQKAVISESNVMPKGPYKMLLIVRMDLKMDKGKIAAQCCHACLGCYKRSTKRNPKLLHAWEYDGQAKVTLKVNSEEEMLELEKEASKAGLITCVIQDAGRTQVAAGSRTVLGIGPASVAAIDKITSHLKLY